MFTPKVVAIAILLQFVASPVMAQVASDAQNAHHYQGGPKTEVPHARQHPKTSEATSARMTTPRQSAESATGFKQAPK